MRDVAQLPPPSEILPATALLRGLFCACGLLLAGCTGFPPTPDDQRRSMQELGQTTISAPLHLPERSVGMLGDLAPKDFLHLVSVGVYSLRDSDASARLQAELTAIAEDRRDSGLTDRERVARQAGGQGSGVALTDDGYIATAAHLVRYANVVVAYLDLAAGRVLVRSVPARIVFVDRQADFAMLKCELATPRFLVPPPEAVPVSTVVFGGGWWNQKGAGRVLESREFRTKPGHRYRGLRTSIPLMQGDSGSAVIDRDGHLLGVASHARYGRLWRMAPKSEAVMLDASELQRLIEQDRAKRR
jgi:S1-C subfamily serine protease